VLDYARRAISNSNIFGEVGLTKAPCTENSDDLITPLE
jgi:hypothetical protein